MDLRFVFSLILFIIVLIIFILTTRENYYPLYYLDQRFNRYMNPRKRIIDKKYAKFSPIN